MTSGTDVVVLGAGVAGCATAYFLAREGVNVKVVEREAIGSCSSGYAVGLLNPLSGTGIPGPMEPLAAHAFKMHKGMWAVLQDEAEVDIQVRLMPHLELCLDADELDERKGELERWSRADGFTAQWLGPEEVSRLEPRITRDLEGAVLLERVGMVDSYR